jgi:zinc/manganese transport system substrate-binding protein
MIKILLLTLTLSSMVFASLKIEATYATLGDVAQKIGGDLVSVHVLGSGKYDPHFIVPKPSLLAKLRRADLLIMNGAGLELGWLPPLIQSANNAKIQNGAKGFLDISHFVSMIDVPTSVSRGFGDVHAEGNPHYTMDPYVVPDIANAIAQKLVELDTDNRATYEKNLAKFLKEWQNYLKTLDAKMVTCKDKKVIEYHELFNYFLKRYAYKSFGNIEPLPGISPSSKHTIALINTMKKNSIKIILQDVYHEKNTAAFIADKTGARVAVIPQDINSVKEADTLEHFYDTIANRICR